MTVVANWLRFIKLCSLDSELLLPIEPPNTRHVYHQFVIRHPRRDALKAFLAEQGIHTQVHYPVPIHLQPAYRELNSKALLFTETIANEILSLPLYPEMQVEDVKKTCQVIRSFLKLTGKNKL